MNKLPNTNCNARLAFNVPKNIAKVKMPHIKKYAAIEDAVGAAKPGDIQDSFGRQAEELRDHQKKP